MRRATSVHVRDEESSPELAELRDQASGHIVPLDSGSSGKKKHSISESARRVQHCRSDDQARRSIAHVRSFQRLAPAKEQPATGSGSQAGLAEKPRFGD